MLFNDFLIEETKLVELYEEGFDCVVGATEVRNPSGYGVVAFNEEGMAERFVEKPKEPISNWALIGVYVFNDTVFDAVKKIKPSWRGELEITDTIQALLTDGARVAVQKVEGWWKDTGKPEDLLEANQLCLGDMEPYNDGEVDEAAVINSRVGIGEGTVIHERTTIRGPAVIGRNCVIGPNAYIGPYTSIGDGSTIQNTEVENSIVMSGARIDCGKRVTDSLIGRNVKILGAEQNIPKGHRLILGDMATVTL